MNRERKKVASIRELAGGADAATGSNINIENYSMPGMDCQPETTSFCDVGNGGDLARALAARAFGPSVGEAIAARLSRIGKREVRQ